MPLVSLTCPQCGGHLSFDDSRVFGFCEFCGQRIMIQQECTHIHVSNSFESQVDRLLSQARTSLELERPQDTMKLLDQMRSIDPTNPSIYLLMAKAIAMDSKINGYRFGIGIDSKVSENLRQYALYSGIRKETQSVYDEYGIDYQSFDTVFHKLLESKDYWSCVRHINGSYSSDSMASDITPYKYYVKKLYEASYIEAKHPLLCLIDLEVFKKWKKQSHQDGSYEVTAFQVGIVKSLNLSMDEFDRILGEFLLSALKNSGFTVDYVLSNGSTLRTYGDMAMIVSENLSRLYADFLPILEDCLRQPGISSYIFTESILMNYHACRYVMQCIEKKVVFYVSDIEQCLCRRYDELHPPKVKKGILKTTTIPNEYPPEFKGIASGVFG